MINAGQSAILSELNKGRRIEINKIGHRRWSDGIRKPSLADKLVAPLFQMGLITQESKTEAQITQMGRIVLKHDNL